MRRSSTRRFASLPELNSKRIETATVCRAVRALAGGVGGGRARRRRGGRRGRHRAPAGGRRARLLPRAGRPRARHR